MEHQPALCLDCGEDTIPCTGKRGCRHAGKWEWYMVWPQVWAAARVADRRFLHIACLEARLGRPLTAADFTTAPVNQPHPWNTQRLNDAIARRPATRRPARRFRAVIVHRAGEPVR